MHATHARIFPRSCVCGLTLVCCSLACVLLFRLELHLAVATQSLDGYLRPCLLADSLQQVCVVNSTMRTVGGKDGRTNVSADLYSAQQALLAAALSPL